MRRRKKVRYNHIKRTYVVDIQTNPAIGSRVAFKMYEPETAPVKITGALVKMSMNLKLTDATPNTTYYSKIDLVKAPEGVNPDSLYKPFPNAITSSTDVQQLTQTYGNEKNLLLSDMGQLYVTATGPTAITGMRTWTTRLSLATKRTLDEHDSLWVIITPPSSFVTQFPQQGSIGTTTYTLKSFQAILEFTTFSTVNV